MALETNQKSKNEGSKNVQNNEQVSHKEGEVTKEIESVTSKLPSGAFLAFGVGAMATSAALQLAGYKSGSRFIGQWVPTVLIMGLYNKLVKLHGSEGEQEA